MKYGIRTINEASNLRIIDDALFRLIASRKDVCQEILRTLLDDDNLVVEDVIVQAREVSLNRELILDALCRLGDNTICNVEMQKTDFNNDVKRVRFHASLLTSNHTPRNANFKDIPNVKILYITEYDVLGNNQAVTHISRCQLKGKTYTPIDDGEDIIFANANSKQRNRHTRLLKLFLRSDSFNDNMYPALSKAMQHFKDSEKGRDEVCKSIEEFANDRGIDTAINICIAHNDSLEETITYVTEQFTNATRDYISSRYNVLSAK